MILDSSSLRRTLQQFRYGHGDPTTIVADSELWRATLTPTGPATIHLTWTDGLQSQAWGPGADWLLAQVPAMTGAVDPGYVFQSGHAVVLAAQRAHPNLRFGASGTLYHELLPTILGQRITAGEALTQWRRLVNALGDKAPGPNSRLRLPPTPSALLAKPTWWFHPLGIEVKRASALREVAKHAARLQQWTSLSSSEAAAKLKLVAGVGEWTIGSVMATAFGDPDALAVGDYHLKHLVVHSLTGRPRGTDEEMLALLEPYAGQRGRVAWLLRLAGRQAPKFGPRRRVQSITQR